MAPWPVPWRVRLALLAGVVAIRLPSLTEPRWYSDDGFFTAVAFAMSKGLRLYAGVFDNSPPGIYWLYRGVLALGGDHRIVQGIATAAVVAAALLTTEIAARVMPSWPAVLAGALTGFALSIPTLDGDLLNVELAALPFFLGSLLAAFGGRRRQVLAGALLACALMTRPSFLFDSVALLVPLAYHRRDALGRLALLAGGGGAVAAAVVGALAWQGSLVAYLTIVLPADHAYLTWSNGGSLAPLAARLALLALAAVPAVVRYRSPASRLGAVWLAGSLAGATLTPREFSHYTHEAIPALAFVAAQLARQAAGARLALRPLAAVAAAAGVILGSQLTLTLPALETAGPNSTPWRPNFTYQRLPAYYGNWLGYASGRRSWNQYAAWFPAFTLQQDEARVIRNLASGDASARMIVLGDEPWLYPQSGLLPATPYIATNSAYSRVPAAPAQMHQALAAGCADVVVARDGAGEWAADLTIAGYVQVAGPLPTYRARAGRSC
jgi:hypothetical protein